MWKFLALGLHPIGQTKHYRSAITATMVRTISKRIAWLLVAAIAAFTLSPIGLRPAAGAPADLERLAAFALTGGIFCLGYPKQRRSIVTLVIGIAGALEVLQHIVPSRHGRPYDFVVKAAAIRASAVFVMLVERAVCRVSAESRRL